MNRRQSLKALAIGSIGAATPFTAWERNPASIEDGALLPEVSAQDEPIIRIPVHNELYGRLQIIAPDSFVRAAGSEMAQRIKMVSYESLNKNELINYLAGGGAMVWIGNAKHVPEELSIGSFVPSSSTMNIQVPENAPLLISDIRFKPVQLQSAYIKPPKEMPMHNIDEEVRADFLPLLEAYDRFGNLAGYPAVLMSYYAPSLTGRRFKGSECFFFFTDDPLKMTSIKEWNKIFYSILNRCESGLQLRDLNTGYASYKPGERVQVTARVQNSRSEAVALTFRFYLCAPGSEEFKIITEMPRVAEGGSDTQAICDFLPPVGEPGLWKIRVDIMQDVQNATRLAFSGGEKQVIDRRIIGFMIVSRQLNTPVNFNFSGPEIIIDKKSGFWSGTHYYPSTSWWEWVWKDFRPLKADEDFAAMRKAGYRIVRIWTDPVLDEQVLRAMDAAIQLASNYDIVLDICIFTQWIRYMGFERNSGEQVMFEFRNPEDFNIVSFSLRNLALQREFIKVLGTRWKHAGNIFYNLANEVYVKDPDSSQMDREVVEWEENKESAGLKRDTLLFNRWAKEITVALRETGAEQPVMPGYMFSTMEGGDVYLGNKNSPIVPWHSYLPTEQTGLTVQYFDPVSSNRPLLLEEFGRLGWNNISNYEENIHYAFSAGAAAAMSYEWGVSWLSRESCFWPIPLREANVEKPDPRWFPPYVEVGKSWPETGVGMCPTPSGTGYGSIYHGTPFPAEAAMALGRFGLMGEGLQRVAYPEKVYVVIPATRTEARETVQQTIQQLWEAKLIFGIWQEDDLGNIPPQTRAIICPASLKSDLSFLKSRGVRIYNGPEGWKSCKAFEKVSIAGTAKVKLISRRTANGILFTLFNKESEQAVRLQFEGARAALRVMDFGMILITKKGSITMLEGTGDLMINNNLFCSIDKGRLLVASEDGKDLLRCLRIKCMVTSPARLVFKRKIVSVSISDGLNEKPRMIEADVSGNVLRIDDQFLKYIIHIDF